AGELADAAVLRGRGLLVFVGIRLCEDVEGETAEDGQQTADDDATHGSAVCPLLSAVSHVGPSMRIYLDNNATTAVHPDVLRVACDAMRDVFGNASSIHKEGQSARRLIEDAREPVAR